MEDLVAKGKAKSIGLSNFNIWKTKRILEIARIVPALNQVECHPYLPQYELQNFLSKHGINLMAHQPLGDRPANVVNPNKDIPGPMSDPVIARIAAQLDSTPAQIILSWLVQRGTSVVPKPVHQSRMKDNITLFQLPNAEFKALNELRTGKGTVRYVDPANHLGCDIFDEDIDQPADNGAPWDT